MKSFNKIKVILVLITTLFLFTLLNSSNLTKSFAKTDSSNLGSTTVINELDEFTSSDGHAGQEFGASVDIDGDTAIVGAPRDNDGGTGNSRGAAYIYAKIGSSWVEQAVLRESNIGNNDVYGRAVAIDGDTAVVTSTHYLSNSGTAFIYTRSGTTWTLQQQIFTSNVPNGIFGRDVDLDGDTLIAGATSYNGNPTGTTAVAYVYTRSGTTWTQQQLLAPPSGSITIDFGFSVSVSGNTAVVGSYSNNSGEGSAFVYTRTGTTWSEQTELTASDGVAGDRFGIGVEVFGDTAIIGAYLDDDDGTDSGSAYIFTRNGTNWTEQQKLTASDAAAGDVFGYNVDIENNKVIIGAHGNDDGGNSSGSAYIFTRSGTNWTEQRKLLASNGVDNDLFGFAVSVSGTTAISGAFQKDVPVTLANPNTKDVFLAGANQGSAYVFDLLTGIFCQPVPPDLVSWWTGDGNSFDIRSRNDGTLQNGTTYGTGKVGQAYSLDGVDDFVELGDLPQTQNADEITVMAWVKRQNTTESRGGIIGKWDNGVRPDNSFLLYNSENANENKGGFALQFDDSSFIGLPGSTLIPFDTWTHIAATWRSSDGQMVIYKNGVQDNTTTAGVGRTIYYHTAYKAWIGRWNTVDSSLFRWQGSIDEPAIFTRALTPAEIQAIANADGRGKCKPTATGNPSGLVGSWAGDGDADDFGGNENGTLQNGAGFAVGKVGQSFKLDGVDDFVSIPDSPANSVSSAITIEGWINPETAPTTFGTILSKYTSPTNNFGYSMALASNQTIQFAVYGNGTGTIQYVVNSIPTIPLNQYTHIAGTFDTATQTMKIYLNGVEVSVSTISSDNVNPIFDSASEVRIGAIDIVGGGSTDQHFHGEIDEISLYSSVLTSTEIKSIFDADLAGKLKSVNTSSTPFNELKSKDQTNIGSSVVSQVGDATITFNSVTADGTTQQIPFDINDMPTLPMGLATGLQYDIATSATYSGDIDICFNLPAFTTSTKFDGLRVMHLENNVWENRTTTSDFATRTLCSTVTSFSPFAIAALAPTAASATISGRILTQKGRGISKATVKMTKENGEIVTAISNQFGYYKFKNINTGQVLIFDVFTKQFEFQTQVINFDENITNLNFIADE